MLLIITTQVMRKLILKTIHILIKTTCLRLTLFSTYLQKQWLSLHEKLKLISFGHRKVGSIKIHSNSLKIKGVVLYYCNWFILSWVNYWLVLYNFVRIMLANCVCFFSLKDKEHLCQALLIFYLLGMSLSIW